MGENLGKSRHFSDLLDAWPHPSAPVWADFIGCRWDILRKSLLPEILHIYKHDISHTFGQESSSIQEGTQLPSHDEPLLSFLFSGFPAEKAEIEPVVDIRTLEESLKGRHVMSIQARNILRGNRPQPGPFRITHNFVLRNVHSADVVAGKGTAHARRYSS
jgi:hypothetical protein